jgi:hypothetical protein
VLAAGGLVLTRTEAIRMESEELSVAPGEITVRYRFRNTGAADIRTIVAFPLPEIDLSQMAETPITAPGTDPDDFVDFRVAVDGRPVPARLEMASAMEGGDGPAGRHGLPVSRFHPDPIRACWRRPPPAQLGRPRHRQGSAGSVYPCGRCAITGSSVPAGAALAVEHRYRPVVGHGWFGQYLLADSDEGRTWRADHCVDDAALARLRAKMALTTAMDPYRPMRTIAYVLTTAANWQGPIGRFRLTVAADKADAVVVGCMLDVDATDFRPDRELSVAIVE